MSMNNLYQEVIMRHFKSPQNYGPLVDEEVMADEENPTCGDHFKLNVTFDDNGRISGVRFDGKGCAISTASCSLMTEHVVGLSAPEAADLADAFMSGMKSNEEIDSDGWGDLKALEGVRQFPLRVKCATLCWVALKRALENTNLH